MRYYVASDIHAYFSIFRKAPEDAGYFDDPGEHKLIILGDLFDRGTEAVELQQFVLEEMKDGRVILIRGNHEDLFELLVTVDEGMPYEVHLRNGTYLTALLLTGIEPAQAADHPAFAAKARETPYYRRILPSMLDYYETEQARRGRRRGGEGPEKRGLPLRLRPELSTGDRRGRDRPHQNVERAEGGARPLRHHRGRARLLCRAAPPVGKAGLY